VLSVVLRNASYFRYRLLLKGAPATAARFAALVVKKVAAVPSGPTNVKGPPTALLAAAWNFTVVLAGVVDVQAMLVQLGVAPLTGLESFTDEIKVPPGFAVE
jgi:hypothetical protein